MWPVAEPFYMVWFVKSQKSISWNTWHVWNKDTRVIWWHSFQLLHPMLVGSQVLSWILRIKKVEGGWEGVRGDEATVFKKPQLWRGRQLRLSKVLLEQSVTRALPERRDQNLGEVGKESFASKEAAEMSLKTPCIFNSIFSLFNLRASLSLFLHFFSFFFFFFLYFSLAAWYGSLTRDQTWTLSSVSTKS